MQYTIPDYYKEFTCIADKCEDTCCAGWQIVIDKNSLAKYKKIPGDFGKNLRKKINWFSGTFRQDKERRCAFLNDNNLCDLYLHEGEKGFCRTCRLYPRHIEEFEGVREISLSISCPEVARILLNRKETVKYLTCEKDGEEEYDEFDPFLFSMLEDARKEILSILQKREIPLGIRTVLVLGMANDIQGRINRQEMFDCFSVIEKYTGKKALNYATEYYEAACRGKLRQDSKVMKVGKTRYELACELFDKLYELELLKTEWDNLLLESQVLLYSKGEKEYERLVNTFEADESFVSETDIQAEQLLVYFIFTYLPGAVYDGCVFSKVQMSVFCVWMIRELWMARYLKNEGELTMEEKVDITYRFSREVEHSDKNRNKIEKMMMEKFFL